MYTTVNKLYLINRYMKLYSARRGGYISQGPTTESHVVYKGVILPCCWDRMLVGLQMKDGASIPHVVGLVIGFGYSCCVYAVAIVWVISTASHTGIQYSHVVSIIQLQRMLASCCISTLQGDAGWLLLQQAAHHSKVTLSPSLKLSPLCLTTLIF